LVAYLNLAEVGLATTSFSADVPWLASAAGISPWSLVIVLLALFRDTSA
jgi:hypothetical protein